MRVVARLLICAALVASAACDKGPSRPDVEPAEPAKQPEATHPVQGRSLELPAAVPAAADAVFSTRLPSPILAAILDADPLRFPAGTAPGLRKELDALLSAAVGMRLMDATTISGFVIGDRDFALLFDGVDSRINLRQVGKHGGVPLFSRQNGRIRLAQLGNLLVVGTDRAATAAIDATRDERLSATHGRLSKLFEETTQDATMAFAVNLETLHPSLKRDLPPMDGVEHGLLIFGPDAVTLRAEGAPDKIEALAIRLNEFRNAVGRAQRGPNAEQVSDDAFLASAVEGDTLTLEGPMSAEESPRFVATALPAFGKYMRRARAAEAPQHLTRIADAAFSVFQAEDPDAEKARGSAVHRCPNDGNLAGQSGITPPLAIDCSDGPGGRCLPAADNVKLPGYYPLSLWFGVWDGLNFQQEQGHFFHYNFIWKNADSGFGACQFTAQAFGDLDGDGVFSTYERYGSLDEDGAHHAAGMYIDRELE